ncbi:hypothetical protein BMS3Abin14_01616 [bacterium BMS3Abin14]|nr:hypothetical protein BMS3Abin14_01616 [bacterium BMS3Abin14]
MNLADTSATRWWLLPRHSMVRNDLVRLRHMLDAAREAVAFVKDRSRADLDSDRMLVLALLKDIEILGEAAGKVGDSTREKNPNIPWQRNWHEKPSHSRLFRCRSSHCLDNGCG